MDLIMIIHKAEGARIPLTDEHGLYTTILQNLWTRADVCILCLLDCSTTSFLKLLKDQPTLGSLIRKGRFLPFLKAEAISMTNVNKVLDIDETASLSPDYVDHSDKENDQNKKKDSYFIDAHRIQQPQKPTKI
eukprot:GHVL01040982.1.p1 GENE.GHVL01040982.1~~GHVL01040982.1.p1  ORF type:complete len:133 (+),score=16.79 GHVL01040982.1:495-893(+)